MRATATTAPSIRGLPPVALVFLALGVVVAVIELWPIVDTWWLGVTEWWSAIPETLPIAARPAAILMLPAAVAWANPDRVQRNRWLWKGALIVAVVQLLRYPAREASGWMFDALAVDGTGGDAMYLLANLALTLPLALGSIVGTWALSEGLKDAGGRSPVAVLISLVVALAFTMLLLVPTLMAGYRLDLEGAAGLLSLGLNVLFLFVGGLLAGRAVAGALNAARPAGAWRAGAIAAIVLWVVPILSLVTLLVSSFLLAGDPVSIPFLSVATYFGWPLFAVALALGMGRLPQRSSEALESSFRVRGVTRYAPAA